MISVDPRPFLPRFVLALVDALRIGRVRERKLPMEQQEQRIRP